MELPILHHHPSETTPAIIRALKRAMLELTSPYADHTDLEGATAVTTPSRPFVFDANYVADAHLPNDRRADDLFQAVEQHYQALGISNHTWISAEQEFPDQLATTLRSNGYVPLGPAVMVLQQAVVPRVRPSDLQILPARAVLDEYRLFRGEMNSSRLGYEIAQQMADCALDALDDSRLDMVVARRSGNVVGAAGVMAAGDIGVIWDVATHPDHRCQGIGRTLMTHIIELCTRAQFRVVAVELDASNEAAQQLYESVGMVRVATYERYRRPDPVD